MKLSLRAAIAALAIVGPVLVAVPLAPTGASAQTPMPMPGMPMPGMPMPGMPGMPGPVSPGMRQVELKQQDIENFIGCYPKLTELGDKYGNRVDADSLANNPAQAFSAFRMSQPALAEMNAVLNAYGFADMNQWIAVAYSIAIAKNWEQGADDPLKKLDEAIARMNADPSINPQQRSFMIAALESQRAALAGMQPSQANVALVRQYDSELDQVLGQ